MITKKQFTTVLLWLARIWASLSVLFLLFMIGAHLIGALTGTGEESTGFLSISEMLSFLFFPLGTLIGLSIALKWEGLGGLITLLGVIGFFIIRPDLILDYMVYALAGPGFLFIIYWLLSRDLEKSKPPSKIG